jgi:WD40 repeat protein
MRGLSFKKKIKPRTRAKQRGGGPGALLSHISARDDAGIHHLNSIAVHPTQPLMAVGDDSSLITLWHISSTQGQRPSKKYIAQAFVSNAVSCLAFHPTQPLLACCSFEEVTLYRTDQHARWLRIYDDAVRDLAAEYGENGESPRMYEGAIPEMPRIRILNSNPNSHSASSDDIIAVAFHPTELFMAANFNNTVNIFQISPDYSNAKLVSTLSIPRRRTVSCIAFNCDGTRLTCACEQDSTVRIYEFLPNGKVTLVGNKDLRLADNILSLTCHPLNPHVACVGVSTGNAVLMSILPTDSGITYNKLHTSAVNSTAFHPRGHVLITGAQDGASEMCEYHANTMRVTSLMRLGAAPAQPVLSVAANVNFTAVCRDAGIEIYAYDWSLGQRIRPAIRGMDTILPRLALSQAKFGISSSTAAGFIKAQVRVAQNAEEYQTMCLTADVSQSDCADAECSLCTEPFVTREMQLVQPVFFHETLKSDKRTVMFTCPVHMSDMVRLVAASANGQVKCPHCRVPLDIKKSQLDTAEQEFQTYQTRVADFGVAAAAASNIGRAFKGHKTRKSSPGRAVANRIKGVYASKIGSAFRGHLTRKSLPGRAVAKRVAREKAYRASRKAFSQEYSKQKAQAIDAIATLTGADPVEVTTVLESEGSRLGDYDEAVRTTAELLLKQKSQKLSHMTSEYQKSRRGFE